MSILENITGGGIWPLLVGAIIGLIIGWIIWGRKKHVGDLTSEGEGQLRTEADSLRARVNELEGETGDLKGKLSAASADAAPNAAASDDDETYALEWRNRYLAARVKYLEGRISDAPKSKPAAKKKVTAKKAPAKKAVSKAAKAKPAKKAVAKKPAAKKPAAKKAPAKKLAAKKATPKKTTVKKVVAKKAPAKKTAAKKAPAKKAPAKKAASPNAKYLAEVRKYDAKASAAVVDSIVKYCGIALRSRDSSLVACSDEKELNTVAKGFCTKKLGMKKGQMDLVKDVCAQMKGQRFKNRVTFYYLCAKSARKMTVFK